jgi:ABC-type transporter Mla subunit MlaD
LHLPLNTRVSIHTEGITGIVYITLGFPDAEPPSPLLIQDGTVVQGVEPFSLQKLQRVITRLADERRVEELVDDAQQFFRQARGLVADARQAARSTDQFMSTATQTAREADQAMGEIRQLARSGNTTLVRTEPVVRQTLAQIQASSGRFDVLAESVGGFFGPTGDPLKGLEPPMQTIRQAAQSVNQASNQVGATFAYLRNELERQGLIAQASDVLSEFQGVGETTTQTLQGLEGLGQTVSTQLGGLSGFGTGLSGLKGIGQSVRDASGSVEQAASRLDCLESGLAEMLSERFLLFKLAFGRPGRALEACTGSMGPSWVSPQAAPIQLAPQPVSGCPPVPVPCRPASRPR